MNAFTNITKAKFPVCIIRVMCRMTGKMDLYVFVKLQSMLPLGRIHFLCFLKGLQHVS